MNTKLSTALLALAGAALVAQSARANTSFNPQDLILGIRATSGTGFGTDFEMDLGPASTFYGATGSIPIAGLNVSDLVGTFGANWNTRSDLLWSVSGTVGVSGGTLDHPNRTMWVTAPREPTAPNALTTPWDRPSLFGAQAPVNQILGLDAGIGGFNNSSANGALSLNAAFKPTTDQNSATLVIPHTPGTSFGYFNPTIENTMSMPYGASVSDLYEVRLGSGPSLLLGDFAFDSSGTLTFNLVPEPGFGQLFAVAGLMVLSLRHRLGRPQKQQ